MKQLIFAAIFHFYHNNERDESFLEFHRGILHYSCENLSFLVEFIDRFQHTVILQER